MGPTVGLPESANTYVSFVHARAVGNKKSMWYRIRVDGIRGTTVKRVPWTSGRLENPRVRHGPIVSMRVRRVGQWPILLLVIFYGSENRNDNRSSVTCRIMKTSNF